MFKTSLLVIAGTFFLFSCGSDSTVEKTGSANDSGNAPVETQSPNTDYKPAFAGQTRIAGIKTTTPYDVKVLTSDLKNPWGIAVLPDGRLLITQKEGNMRIATTSGQVSDSITGLLPVHWKEQGGLLGITVDPQFTSNRMVYWTFSQDMPDGNLTAVAKGKLSADEHRIENAMVIYQATPAFASNLHYGGRILFDKSGNLIISTGERSDLKTRPKNPAKSTGFKHQLRQSNTHHEGWTACRRQPFCRPGGGTARVVFLRASQCTEPCF